MTLLHGEVEEVLSWVPGTSDALLQKTACRLLGFSDDDEVLFVVDAGTEPAAMSKHDTVLLSGVSLQRGYERVRVYTMAARANLPDRRPRAASPAQLPALGGVAGASPALATNAPSFLHLHVNALTIADSSLVPRLQCTVHLLTLHDVDPRTECFTAVLNFMIDWRDEQLAGKQKEEIDEIINDKLLYGRPTLTVPNMVSGGDELSSNTLRCDNSKTGHIKLTAQISGTFASAMDMHRFPFDTQTLHIETKVRSITLDKRRLHAGEGKKKIKERLMVYLLDASHTPPVRAGRRHWIDLNADKVHEWDFCTTRTIMAQLESTAWRQLEKQHVELVREQSQARNPAEGRAALTKRVKLLKQMSHEVPQPLMKYSPLLSAPEEGKHVVLFEIGRLVRPLPRATPTHLCAARSFLLLPRSPAAVLLHGAALR